MTLDEIIRDMEQAVAARTIAMQPAKGMSVPYHGPLCSAVPSVLKDVSWWVARLKEIKIADEL